MLLRICRSGHTYSLVRIGFTKGSYHSRVPNAYHLGVSGQKKSPEMMMMGKKI